MSLLSKISVLSKLYTLIFANSIPGSSSFIAFGYFCFISFNVLSTNFLPTSLSIPEFFSNQSFQAIYILYTFYDDSVRTQKGCSENATVTSEASSQGDQRKGCREYYQTIAKVGKNVNVIMFEMTCFLTLILMNAQLTCSFVFSELLSPFCILRDGQ